MLSLKHSSDLHPDRFSEIQNTSPYANHGSFYVSIQDAGAEESEYDRWNANDP